ncbi:MAG: thioredoxin family protein [Bacteroidota bacterium]
MKKVTMTCCLLLAAMTLFAKTTPLSFQTSNIQAGIQAAAHAEKLLMAHFVADWCMPSKWMEEHAFNHPEIKRFLTDDYLSIKVDIDETAGFQDKERYQVETLPTILIFSASGKMLERIEGITDTDEIRKLMRKHNLFIHKNGPGRLTPSASTNSNAIDFSHLDRPAFKQSSIQSTSANERVTISTPNLPMTMEEVYGPASSSPDIVPTNTPNNQAVVSEIYGVEVAVLEQYGQVIKYVRSLEKRVSDKVFIRFSKDQGRRAYHVIIGKMNNRKAAFKLRTRLSAYNIQGVVKVLDTI